MSYEPNIWVAGNRITAEKMNHMEQGIASASGGGAPLIIRYVRTETSGDTYTHYFDKTWQEVADALANYIPVYIHSFGAFQEYEESPHNLVAISYAYRRDGVNFYAEGMGGLDPLQANSADGTLYVSFTGGDDD